MTSIERDLQEEQGIIMSEGVADVPRKGVLDRVRSAMSTTSAASEVRPVLSDPIYDQLHAQVVANEAAAAKIGRVEKTPSQRSAENIRTIFSESIGYMNDFFPSGVNFPDLIWLETGETSLFPEDKTTQLLSLVAKDNRDESRSQAEGHLTQYVVAVDRMGRLKMLQPKGERNDYGELKLDEAESRDATDEEVVRWALPLLEIVRVRLENDRIKSIGEDQSLIAKGERLKMDSSRTIGLTKQLTRIGLAKDLILLEKMRSNGHSKTDASHTAEQKRPH